MKKRTFYTELAYVFGIIALALGVALMEKADLGMSMVVVPAYLLHLKLSPIMPFFTFGMAEYTLQAVLVLVVCAVMRRFRLSYFFSFVTAVIYGFILDGFIWVMGFVPAEAMAARIIFYALGMVICSMGVSLVFHTYIAPEAYELFVKELSGKFGVKITLFKTCFDLTMLTAGVVMSFAFFGMWQFEGVKLGTVICALLNGFTIGLFTRFFEGRFEFSDRLPAARRFF